MPYCVNCGQQVKEGTKFCTNCGSAIIPHTKPKNNERTIFYDGEIHKCPNCGEIINSFVANCPSCGYELRGSSAANSVQELYRTLNLTNSTSQKTLIIRNFPIPNAKEDIIEFMILASSNISGEADKCIFEAWVAKFEQAYQKAMMTLQNDPAISQIESIYEKTEKAIAIEKFSHTTVSAGNIVSNFFKAMPNPVFAIVAVLVVVFNIMRLFSKEFSAIDIIFDVIILSIAYKITWHKEKWSYGKTQQSSTVTSPEVIYQAKVPFEVKNGSSDNYVIVETLFAQAGFTNIRTVPLNDLTFGVMNKPGNVDSITINGKEVSTYFRRKFDANSPVVITYHSLRR